MQCAADNYEAGDAADAFAWIDNDVRREPTMEFSAIRLFLRTPNLAAASMRYGHGIANSYGLPVWSYQGGFQDLAPTVAQCQASPIAGVNATLGTGSAQLTLVARPERSRRC